MNVKKITHKSLLLLTFASSLLLLLTPAASSAASSVSISPWWPTNGTHMQGVQPFKAMVPGLDVSQYDMYWQVDGGQWNSMANNYTGYQHKEANVDVSGWSWRGTGPYVVNFIARQGGAVVAQQSETIYTGGSSTASPASAAPAQITNTTLRAPAVSGNLYVDPYSQAAQAAKALAGSNNPEAVQIQMLAAQPTALWFGDWNSNVESDVHTAVAAAQSSGSVPVLVAYDIPERDCGGFSSGGSNNPSGYASWARSFAAGLGSAKAIVIVEPDALAQMSCLSSADQATRLQLLSGAVAAMKEDQNAKVYLDAGHSGWIDSATMASDLSKAGIAQADGFSLNVSNFMSTASEVEYGQSISSQTGGKHFVIDTSRNGNGNQGQWCNPLGAAIGAKPTTQTNNPLVDAYLWVKIPGESDGTCSGGPSAGQWWLGGALSLLRNAHN